MEERENNPKRQYAEYDYDMDMKMQGQKHYNEGIQIGEARGKIKGLISTATRMKKANCDVAFIQEMTGLI